jgi:glutamine cyclotransferase
VSRASLRALGLLCVLGLGAGAVWATTHLGTPVRRFASPGDYPEGLAWDGTHLWSNNFSDGVLYRVDPHDGHAVASYSGNGLPTKPEGLAWDGEFLWTCDWVTGVISKVRTTPTGVEVVANFDKPAGSGKPVGLEWDGSSLWLACFGAQAGDTSELWQLDPTTLAPERMLRLPIYWVEDLAWDGRYLWSVDWLFRIGFAIDRATGDTLHTYHTPGPHPVGQAWDGNYLWLSDTDVDSIWALDISAAQTSAVRRQSWTDVKRKYGGRN